MIGSSQKLMGAAGGGEAFIGWNLSTATLIPDGMWNVSRATYTQSFSVLAQGTAVRNPFFKPDGTKMFIADRDRGVNEYNLSTAWDLSTSVYSQTFDPVEEVSLQGLFFRDDGLKMYLTGWVADAIIEYDLSTAWDVSTAVFLQSFSVSAQMGSPVGLYFKPDGTKVYVLDFGSKDVNEYDLSTAWDVSTASYLQTSTVSISESQPWGLSFKPDGTKMYTVGLSSSDVREYNLSTAWDVSTASFLREFFVGSQEGATTGLYFRPDGTAFYITGYSNDGIFEFVMSGGFATANAYSLTFSSDGTNLYYVYQPQDSILQYTVSEPWTLTGISFVQNVGVGSGSTTEPSDLVFKPDGTKLYVMDVVQDRVREYDLSTPWDMSTISFRASLGVAAGGSSDLQYYMHFKPDGTRLYTVDQTSSSVRQWDLSTAWEIDSGTFGAAFSVASQDTVPRDLFFRPDGKKMYVGGAVTDIMYEYDLSTAWDVTTATLLQSFDVKPYVNSPGGLFFKPDGTLMHVIDRFTSKLYSYALTA